MNNFADILGFASGVAGLGRHPYPAGTSASTASVVAGPSEVIVCE